MRHLSLGAFRCPHCSGEHPRGTSTCPSTGRDLRAEHKMAGRVLDGSYRVLEMIAEGGMGVVYRGQHRRLGSRVAIKFLRAESIGSRAACDLFMQEARLVSRVEHPGIVMVHDLGFTQGGVPYIVMDHLEGEDLAVRLDARDRLDVRESVGIARQMLEALEAVHRSGIVHRDLKPENVYLAVQSGGESIVKILDFGISHLLDPAQAHGGAGTIRLGWGTPEYVAPERVRGGEGADGTSADLWAAGAIVYEMLVGRPPFQGASARETIESTLRDPTPDPGDRVAGLPSGLRQFVMRALDKDPARRFVSAGWMLRALESASRDRDRDPAPRGNRRFAPTSTYRIIGSLPEDRIGPAGALRDGNVKDR